MNTLKIREIKDNIKMGLFNIADDVIYGNYRLTIEQDKARDKETDNVIIIKFNALDEFMGGFAYGTMNAKDFLNKSKKEIEQFFNHLLYYNQTEQENN